MTSRNDVRGRVGYPGDCSGAVPPVILSLRRISRSVAEASSSVVDSVGTRRDPSQTQDDTGGAALVSNPGYVVRRGLGVARNYVVHGMSCKRRSRMMTVSQCAG